MRSIVLSALLIVAALSGCLAKNAEPATASDASSTDPTTSPSTTTTASTNGSADPNATTTTNTPPTANLTSDVENGSAPLNVTFTIAAADEDGDELSWTLDVDGDGEVDYNGTSGSEEILHQYTTVGNYTAILNVTDGDAFAEASASIAVEEPVVAGPNICHRPTAGTAGIYQHGEGGTWVFRESNGIPGLQVGNTHPTGPNGGGVGFANPDWATCVNGDQMLV